MKMPKEWRKLKKQAEDQGWTVEKTKNNHIRWTNPDGEIVISPSTPSENRGMKNFLSVMKKKNFKP